MELSNRDSQTWEPYNPSLTENEMAELLVRVLVRDRFKDALDGKLEPELLNDLERILFEVIYPTLPMNPSENESKFMKQLH